MNTANNLLASLTALMALTIVALLYKQKKLEKEMRERHLEKKNLIKEIDRYEKLLIQQARKASMGEMIGNIAHQWKQPLNTLMLILANLEDAYIYNDLDREYFESIMDKSRKIIKQMSVTIDDFRHFFNPLDEKEIFCPWETVKSILFLLEEKFSLSDINVIFLEEGKTLSAYGYKNQYSQAVFNVVNNSIDALDSESILDKRIQIRVYEKEDMVVCEILDNAGGAPDEILNKIFDIYVTTKCKEDGTGLGLYIAKTIIEKNMNGKIECRNYSGGLQTLISIQRESEER